MVGRGMNPSHVRQMNMRAVLSVVSLQPGITNAELSRLTQLAPQTVSAVLLDLEEAHLIKRGEVLRGRRGQPATPLFMDATGAFAIGAEISWTHIDVALVGIGIQIADRYHRDYAFPDPLRVFDELRDAIDVVTRGLSSAERARLQGLAVAVPGGLGDTVRFFSAEDERMAGWVGLDVASTAARVTGLNTMIVSDGNAACWAERVAHPPPRPLGFLYLRIDTLMAAGIVAENRLWEGEGGDSTRLGSMLVTDRNGTSRFVQQIASVQALQGKLAQHGLSLEAAMSGDHAGAQAILDDWIEECALALAQVIINTATILEHEVAIVETALGPAITRRIVDRIRTNLDIVPLPAPRRSRVIAGHVGRPDAAYGAALLKMYRRFFSREQQHIDL